MSQSTHKSKREYFEKHQIANGLETIWDIHEIEDINAECVVKIDGKKIVYKDYKCGFSEDVMWSTEFTYTTVVEGNTWLDLWKAANKVMLKSGTHHSWIEDFTVQEDGSFLLTTGS